MPGYLLGKARDKLTYKSRTGATDAAGHFSCSQSVEQALTSDPYASEHF